MGHTASSRCAWPAAWAWRCSSNGCSPTGRPATGRASLRLECVSVDRWVMRPTHPEDGSALAYGMRLLATVALTLALIAGAGYLLLEGTLGQRQIAGAQLDELRLILGLIGLLGPIAGVAAFY